MRASYGAHHKEMSVRRAERIKLELVGTPERPPNGPQPGREFLTVEQAAEMLCISDYGLLRKTGLPRIKSGYLGSDHGGGRRPYLYRREHVERAVEIRKAARISARAAVSVVVAEIEGRL